MICPECGNYCSSGAVMCPACSSSLDSEPVTANAPPTLANPFAARPAIVPAPEAPAIAQESAATPALPAGELRGQVRRIQREVGMAASIPVTRWVASAVVFLAWAPVLLVVALFVLLLLVVTRSVATALITNARGVLSGADPRGGERGVQFELSLENLENRSIKVRKFIVGSLEEGDDVIVRVRSEGPDLFLTRGVNLSQGSASFRAPRYPWPGILGCMILWIGIMAFYYP